MKNINPNYSAYAASRRMTPEACLKSDEKTYPGGKMCGFILFISEEKNLFDREQGKTYSQGSSTYMLNENFYIHDSEKFSQWLQAKYLIIA